METSASTQKRSSSFELSALCQRLLFVSFVPTVVCGLLFGSEAFYAFFLFLPFDLCALNSG